MTPSDRYLVGLPRGAGRIFLSWRLLASDRPDACFHVERRRGDRWERVSSESVVDSTNFLDRIPEPARYEYRVTAPEGSPSQSVKVDSGAPATMLAVDAPLVAPIEGWGKIALGDLNNDGRMGYVVSSIEGEEVQLYAYRCDGKPMRF